ncbi:hypothetical protein AVEN_174952-1 [Araneus ventricosus]|uniref:Sulfotransferase domain-containing protein n=1 Tax=Araneus ventricosus TaxID=182803 RepID=A0A4Y2U2Q6_ARAVE|nr:hypothetical protein AVEN_174952-1 [Araneus ventricosus]
MSKIQIIRGIPFPNVNILRENIEGTIDYPPRDRNIIIASYPNTGTTYLQYMVLQIIIQGRSFHSCNEVLDKVIPFMEMNGPEAIDNLTGVRMYKHCYRNDMVKKNTKPEVLYMYRNHADTLPAFYYFLQGVWEKR